MGYFGPTPAEWQGVNAEVMLHDDSEVHGVIEVVTMTPDGTPLALVMEDNVIIPWHSIKRIDRGWT